MRKAFATCLVVLGTIACTGWHASALTISDADSYSGLLTELANQPLRVDLFDASLGTLNSVTVTISGALRSVGTVTNRAAQPQTFTISTRVQQYDGALAAGGPAALAAPFEVLTPFSLIGQQTYTSLAPNISPSFGPAQANSGLLTVLTSTDSSVLGQFVGSGEFGYDFNTSILTITQGGGGNAVTSIQTSADATLTVTYDYAAGTVSPAPSPVPEPSTFGLLGVGLAGLLYARRRTIKK